jgi:pyruvate/2-oxoglutarate dehydrogenase complex dihydrolipoamide acyltransferase (E2) component
MSLHSICAPQLGEGIKELKIISFLKQLGEGVEKDEPILLVETEKASMEIESPVAGIIQEIKAQLQEKVPVGHELIIIQTDIDERAEVPSVSSEKTQSYREIPLSERQHSLVKRIRESNSKTIPTLLQTSISAQRVQSIRKSYRAELKDKGFVPSSTEIIAWCVLQAMQKHPRFCSTISEDERSLRQQPHASLGIAVSMAEDDLSIMRISNNECLDFEEFCKIYKERIADVRAGIDHSGPHSVSISDLSAYDIESALPVIVSPTMATLCIGGAFEGSTIKTYNFSFVFDHRIVNGVGAAQFLGEIKIALKNLETEPRFSSPTALQQSAA